MRKLLIFATVALFTFSCGHKKPSQSPVTTADYTQVQSPSFNADSAYSYVAQQLSFGYRIPGTSSHSQCAGYLSRKMAQWCDTVIVQEFSTTLWNGNVVRGKNIISSINAENPTRIVLAAHWDSRLWADHDPDESLHKSPIMGANDGASGVGALMEMARVMSEMPPSVGVDFIFFDVEDQGTPEWADSYEDNTWCKGSQYWSQNPHVPYYRAAYGILYDMVGTQNPRFTKEEVSRHYAPGVISKVWAAAAQLGYSNIFQDVSTDAILDDHLYVNQITGIPMIDIVQNSPKCSFFPYWHTVKDNLDCISKETMETVSTVILKVIYQDYPAQK